MSNDVSASQTLSPLLAPRLRTMQALRTPAADRLALRPSGTCRRSRARGTVPAVTAGGAHAEEEGEESGSFDARAFRRQLGQSGNYTRKHMRDEDAAKAMEAAGVGAVSAGAWLWTGDMRGKSLLGHRARTHGAHSRTARYRPPTGGLISQMKTQGFRHQRGNLTLTLAQSYGFCWGVERAVQMAYEARKQYPQEKLWITNEIIHNPSVNQARRGGACSVETRRLFSVEGSGAQRSTET